MRGWRMSLRRTTSTIISWDGSFVLCFATFSGSRTSKMCTTEAKSETGTLLYLKNQDYPQQIRGDGNSCTCSIEAKSCDSQVNVYILHLDLSNGSPGVCNPNQKIVITDKGNRTRTLVLTTMTMWLHWRWQAHLTTLPSGSTTLMVSMMVIYGLGLKVGTHNWASSRENLSSGFATR